MIVFIFAYVCSYSYVCVHIRLCVLIFLCVCSYSFMCGGKNRAEASAMTALTSSGESAMLVVKAAAKQPSM